MLDFKKIISSIADVGKGILGKKFSEKRDLATLVQLCDDLISYKGTASGIAIPEAVPLYEIRSSQSCTKVAKSLFSENFFPNMPFPTSAMELIIFLKSSIFSHKFVW